MREILKLKDKIIGNRNDPTHKGYFPLNDLAEKYGYAKDHIGWLARTGRVQAVRYGKHGRWYANERSLLDHRQHLTDKLERQSAQSSEKSSHEFQVPRLTSSVVPFFVPSHKSSYSAKPFDKPGANPSTLETGSSGCVRSELRRINAIPRTFLLLVGGILFWSVYIQPYMFENGPRLARAALGDRVYAGIFDVFKNVVRLLTDDITTQTYLPIDSYDVFKKRIDGLEERLSQQTVVPFQPQVKSTREIVSGPSGIVLTKIEERLNNAESLIAATRINLSTLAGDLASFQRITPTTIQLPSTNTKGVSSVTLNPEKLESGSLSVTGGSTLNSLSVTNNLDVDTNTFYVNSTDNRVGIGTTGPTSLLTVQGRGEFQGTASASYLLTGNTLQVGGFSSAAYSRFGTNTTGHANYITTTNDVLVSGDLEVDGSASFAGVASISGKVFLLGLAAVTDNRSVCANATSGELEFVDGACGASSARYKENIVSLGGVLGAMKKLNPVYYNYLTDSELADNLTISDSGRTKRRIGFIAEEMAEIFPEAVKYGEDGLPEGIDYPNLTAVLAGAVQELDTRTASLSMTIDEINARIASQLLTTSGNGTIFDLDILFNSVVKKFNDVMNIVFDNGLLKVANIITDRLTAKEVAAEKLCIGQICVTEQELKALLEKNGIQTQSAPASTPMPTPEPAPSPTPEATPTLSPSESPAHESTTPEPTPTPSLEPSSSPSESPTPSPTPEPASEPTPEPAAN